MGVGKGDIRALVMAICGQIIPLRMRNGEWLGVPESIIDEDEGSWDGFCMRRRMTSASRGNNNEQLNERKSRSALTGCGFHFIFRSLSPSWKQ
jgi:hypothetical protein